MSVENGEGNAPEESGAKLVTNIKVECCSDASSIPDDNILDTLANFDLKAGISNNDLQGGLTTTGRGKRAMR